MVKIKYLLKSGLFWYYKSADIYDKLFYKYIPYIVFLITLGLIFGLPFYVLLKDSYFINEIILLIWIAISLIIALFALCGAAYYLQMRGYF